MPLCPIVPMRGSLESLRRLIHVGIVMLCAPYDDHVEGTERCAPASRGLCSAVQTMRCTTLGTVKDCGLGMIEFNFINIANVGENTIYDMAMKNTGSGLA